jgi:hypothetical protein
MARPTNREEFKEYVLRNLGQGAVRVNVTDEQLDDRVDEALIKFRTFHYEGTEKVYLDHVITQDTIDNKYITLDEDIIGVVRIFDIGFGGTSVDLLNNVFYQLYMSEVQNLDLTATISNYVVLRTNLSLMQEILVGRQQIRFNEHTDRVYIDIDRQKLTVGKHIILEAYRQLPEDNVDMWGDQWFQRYATALVQRQWARNIGKFGGVQLPGGVTLNASEMKAEAQGEIDKLEAELTESYSFPAIDMIA